MGIKNEKPSPPNCRGYAFHSLGLIDEEVFVREGTLEDFPFIERVNDPSEAEAIGILMENEGEIRLMHIMVIDLDDRNYVWHRPDTGLAPIREPGLKAITEALNGIFFPHELILLKRSQ